MEKDLKAALDDKTLNQYLKNRTHHSYKFYSTYNRIENIIKNRCLYLSDGKKWNDKEDRESFNSEKSDIKNFGLCFSFSRSENVALWMLYGGMDKSGALIDLKKRMFGLELDDKPSIKLGFFKDDKFQACLELSSKDYTVDFWDVLYYGKKNESDIDYSIKHSDKVCNNVPEKKFKEITFLKKRFVWNYENETRLVVSVSKSLLKNNEIDTVQFPLKVKTSKDLKDCVVLAPNYSGTKQHKLSSSSLGLDWDLCKNCQKK